MLEKAQAKAQAAELVAKRVVDISAGFPAANAQDYLTLAYALFQAGVYRIPIIGLKATEQITSLALFSDGVQEHHQLANLAQIPREKMVYTTSLEGYPFGDFDPFLSYIKILAREKEAYQRIGRGSDYYPVQLSEVGIAEVTRIFINIGVLTNV